MSLRGSVFIMKFEPISHEENQLDSLKAHAYSQMIEEISLHGEVLTKEKENDSNNQLWGDELRFRKIDLDLTRDGCVSFEQRVDFDLEFERRQTEFK